MTELNEVQVREQAAAKNAEGIAIYKDIKAGKRGIEDRPQADALIKEAGELCEQIRVMKQAAIQDAYLNSGLGSVTAGGASGQPPNGGTKAQWASSLEWLCSLVAYGVPKHKAALLKQGVIKEDFEQKLLTEGVGADGGFLVPVQYRPEVFAKPGEAAIVRPRAVAIPMGAVHIQMPSLDQTLIPNNQLSAYFGGILFEWVEEASQKPELELHFKLIDLIVHELAGWLPVSNNLIADSAISLEAWLRGLLGRAMADAEDWWFINGNGVGQPQGVIHAPCTIQPNRAVANQICFDDVASIVHAFEPNPRGIWLAHICTMEQIMQLQDDNNNFIWIPNMRDGMPERLFGYQLWFTEKVPNLGTKGDIGLYDFGYYLIGDRQQPAIESSIHERFRQNQTTFRISERVDGKPWLSAPVALRPDGTVSISPFVSLDVPRT
jgi:HK97 family phage major capsid protein